MDTKSLTMRTHDFGLATALVSSGFEISTTNRDINGRFYFMFKQTDKLTHVINSYWANTLDVKARTFFDNTKMLKSLIYAEE